MYYESHVTLTSKTFQLLSYNKLSTKLRTFPSKFKSSYEYYRTDYEYKHKLFVIVVCIM